MDSNMLTILEPALTWLAVAVALAVKKGVPDWIVTTFIVPAASGLATYIGTLTFPEAPWYVPFALGLVSTFLREFLKNLGRAIADYFTGKPVARQGDAEGRV